MAVPEAAQDPVRLFLGHSLPGEGISYFKASSAAGLASGKADGVILADFNQDGDVDLYVGRPDTQPFYFQNRATSTSDAPTRNWVAFQLEVNGGNNRMGIGAQLKLEAPQVAPQLIQIQTVDGGSSRGGQAPAIVTFGLDQFTDAELTVRWPDGYVQTVAVPADSLNRVQTIIDDHLPQMVPGSIVLTKAVKVGGLIDLTWEWDCVHSSDPARDKVILSGSLGSRDNPLCNQGPITLTPGLSTVDHEYDALPGGGYHHKLTWRDQDCVAVCNYSSQVVSSVDAVRTETSADIAVKILVCAN